MSRAKRFRRKHPQKWVKKTDMKRPCPSGKRGFKKGGEARAAAPAGAVVISTCEDCGLLHIADRVSRRERQARARGLAA